MRKLLVCLLIFAGCAVPERKFQRDEAPQEALPPATPRLMLFYMPQNEEGASAWLKWFDTHPALKLTIAVSPRFGKIARDPALRTRIDMLVKEGRLELALQLPNAPILPLLMENPPYGYSDDVVQLIAQAKAGFYKAWGVLPKGLVLPYGAANPRLLSLLERSGFSWVCGAWGLDPIDGPYQIGSLLLWDGAPASPPMRLMVRVWDERQAKDRPMNAWMAELKKYGASCVIPRDTQAAALAIDKNKVQTRTWASTDLSLWIGDPDKNTAWSALRKTREALEKYKNSGQASVSRLDAAFAEIYSAQNSNFFAAAGNATLSPALVEERAHEFQASLSSVYRMMSQPIPDDLFSTSTSLLPVVVKQSSTSITSSVTAEGVEQVIIREAFGDALMVGGEDILSMEVRSSSDSLQWAVMLSSMSSNPTLEIYIDLNAQANVGTSSFLPGRPMNTAPKDAWEYAISIMGTTATLYRTQGSGSYGVLEKYPVVIQGNRLEVVMQPVPLRGKPSRWGYQMLSGSAGLADFIDPINHSQKEIWDEFSGGNRHDLPFLRKIDTSR